MEKLKRILIETIGLTNSEAYIYLALLKLKESKVGKVIAETSLQSSVVHNSILSLINKGLVSFVIRNKIKHYFALNPETIEHLILSKRDKFVGIVEDLNKLSTQKNNVFPIVEVFNGKRGMLGASLKLFEDAKRGDVHKYFGVSFDLLNDDVIKFFEMLETRRKDVGLVVKGIVEINNKDKLKNWKSSEIRFSKVGLPPAMSIFKNRVLFMMFEEGFSGILIESEELARQYHNLWDEIWGKEK